MIAVAALKSSHFSHDEIPSFNSQGLPLDERFGHLAPRSLDNPAEGRPRDLHPFRRLLVIHPLFVRKAQRLKLVDPQDDLLKVSEWDAARFEIGGVRVLSDAAAKRWSGHIHALSRRRSL
jgi:hypothetical protein